MTPRLRILAVALAAALAPAAAAAQRPEPVPARVSPNDVSGWFRWIEGSWRGTHERGGDPFYEGYRLVNDSTLEVSYFADSTRTGVSGTGVFALRGGRLVHETGGARWVATAVDGERLRFAPVAEATNRFTWLRLSPTAWTATLEPVDPAWPATVYRMERVAP